MDLSKLSDFEPKESSGGLNVLDAIKLIREMISEAKELQKLKQQPKGESHISESVAAKPSVALPLIPKKEEKQGGNMDLNKIDKSKGFDMLLTGLEKSLLLYGEDISAKQLISNLRRDKDKILSMLKFL